MTFGQRLVSRILPPVALAAITLSVFAILQNNGPRSVIRRLYEALERGDDAQIYSLMVQSTPRPNQEVEYLKYRLLLLRDSGFEPYSTNIADRQSVVYVAVNYYSPERSTLLPVDFVLVRQNGRCKIDAAQTLSIHRRF